MENGTGKSLYIFIFIKKYSSIDFSGIDEDNSCYRDDDSPGRKEKIRSLSNMIGLYVNYGHRS